jgi:hypothetical protein
MRIGIDFDNTIVNYDLLFHKVALERGLIPAALPQRKLAVRDHLRFAGQEPLWTELQGYVYGRRMSEAAPYPALLDFLEWAKRETHQLYIVSHKTRHPFVGPAYDLHAAARDWILHNLVVNADLIIPLDQIFFELTKEDKIERISQLECDIFIDDLPEILRHHGFPHRTQRILFDPDQGHETITDFPHADSWNSVLSHVQALCQTPA